MYQVEKTENSTAKLIRTASFVLVILGMIGSFVLANESDEEIVTFVTYAVPVFFMFLFFYGLAEIISLLHDIRKINHKITEL